MLFQIFGIGAVTADNNGITSHFSDSFDYTQFTAESLYDSTDVWVSEYKNMDSDSDFGYYDCAAPVVEGGVAKFEQGYGLRLNWQSISAFSTFDSAKTYTFKFDIKVTDFGNDDTMTAITSWNREAYCAFGGYLNQIEFRSGNYDNQLGIRAGDKTDAYPNGGWTNDLSTYKKDTVYTCTVVWSPSAKTVISTVKNGSIVIAQGIRTSDNYADVNKYTRSFVWRCEDGSMELDNFSLSDGTNTYSQSFSYASVDGVMTGNGVWGLETVRKTDAVNPTLSNGILKLGEKASVQFNWTKVKGIGEYDATKNYIFEFDAKITDKGDGSVWGGSGNTRALYVAFGGWYNLLEINDTNGQVKIGSNTKNFADADYLNKSVHVTISWSGDTISTSVTDASGNVLISGSRTSSSFTDMTAEQAAMTYLVLRCEDGAAEIDNFTFKTRTSEAISTTALNIADGKQAIYKCDLDYDGMGMLTLKCGATDLVAFNAKSLAIGGKAVTGTFAEGTYSATIKVNPSQTMLSIELVCPDGSVVRRGYYTLLGGDAIYVYADANNSARNVNLTYEAVSLNQYTLTTSEPTYSGFNANVYNLVTSFDNAQTTRNFAWTAKTAYLNGAVMALKYRVAGTTSWTVVDANKETELVETADEDYFKCDLVGLTANTTYEFKIGKKNSTDETNDWSKIYSFTTAPESIDEFTFVAVGDTQGLSWDGTNTSTKGYMYAQAAFNEAFEEVPNAAFMVHTGDVVERGYDKNMWNWYFKSLGDYGSYIPSFTAIGNHDTQGTPFYFDLHFNHPNNGGAAAFDMDYINAKVTNSNILTNLQTPDELTYSYDYGDAHFTVLYTGSYVGDDRYLLEAQRDWLENDLKNSNAKWKILIIHEPVYHRVGGGESRPWLYDVIEGYGVDLVLQGHSHLVTRTYPMKDGEIVSKTVTDDIPKGMGTVYTTIGSTTLNHDGTKDTFHIEEMFSISTPTMYQPAYTTVSVKDSEIVVTVKQVDGLVLDRFVIYEDENYQPVVPSITESLALGKSYVTSEIYAPNGTPSYPDENGKTLTDGKNPPANASYDNYAFVGFNKSSADYQENGYAYITVDLGDVYSVDKFVANVASMYNAAVGIYAPSEISVYVSTDNESYKEAGRVIPVDTDTVSTIAATIELENSVLARYVQFRIVVAENKGWMFVSDLEVYECEPATEPTFVMGDVNADGKTDATDYLLVKRSCFNTYVLNTDEKQRADVDGNDIINSLDYTLVKRIAFGTYSV